MWVTVIQECKKFTNQKTEHVSFMLLNISLKTPIDYLVQCIVSKNINDYEQGEGKLRSVKSSCLVVWWGISDVLLAVGTYLFSSSGTQAEEKMIPSHSRTFIILDFS